MAGKPGAWGLDIGQAGLKAIRLETNDATEQVVATAFDFIAHPKILSQPDAIPEELIAQAIDKFLKQNVIGNDVIGISVPGQSALARFIQLPPVEASKVSEIVKYEAKQQIPFALEDVVWDYQTLGKGTEESGFLLEAEVGLFAMKRDQVVNHLKPFTKAGIEVELIQIAPLALYNFLSFDQLGIRLGDEAVAMDTYTILLDMGADNTTLLVSNGQKIWIRNVPIGGNHFTRALTKEMKLTFAKAEHLKCNATKSPDPRAVFQALRPVFNDYVSEIQRSIGYFSSVNREAKISKVVGLGNGFKLAGLQKFLQQNLQYEVERVDSFSAISPDTFKDAALFEENILSFPVCYGVALQALRQTRIHTSLLPKEITTARTIARKKPWAVAAAALLLVGLATSAFGYARVYKSVSVERFKEAEDKVKSVDDLSRKLKGEYKTVEDACKAAKEDGRLLVGALAGRTQWLDLYNAIDACLPRDQKEVQDIRKQNRIRINSIKTRWHPDLNKEWYADLSPHAVGLFDDESKKAPPTGGGYVVTLEGEHYHDELMGEGLSEGKQEKFVKGRSEGFVYEKFVKALQQLRVAAGDTSAEIPVREAGITHATVVMSRDNTLAMDPLKTPAKRYSSRHKLSTSLRSFGGGRDRRRDKRAEKNTGGMGFDQLGDDDDGLDLTLTPLGQLGPAADKTNKDEKKVRLTHTTFVVELVWMPDKAVIKSDATAALSATASPTTASATTAPGAKK